MNKIKFLLALSLIWVACKTPQTQQSTENYIARDSAMATLVFQDVEDMEAAFLNYPSDDTLSEYVGKLINKHHDCLKAFQKTKVQITADSSCQVALKGEFFDILNDYDISMAILNSLRKEFYPITVIGKQNGQNPYEPYFNKTDASSVFICLVVLDQLEARLNENAKLYLSWLRRQSNTTK